MYRGGPIIGDPLPHEVMYERLEAKRWESRVGFRGCPSPAVGIVAKERNWPFTVLPHVVEDDGDYHQLMLLLSAMSWKKPTGPFDWVPIRPYENGDENPYGGTVTEVFLDDPNEYLLRCEEVGSHQARGYPRRPIVKKHHLKKAASPSSQSTTSSASNASRSSPGK